MPDPLEKVQALAIRARQEQTPRGDVSRQVLSRIRQSHGPAPMPLAPFAAASACAAAVVVAWSSVYIASLADPLTSFFGMANALIP